MNVSFKPHFLSEHTRLSILIDSIDKVDVLNRVLDAYHPFRVNTICRMKVQILKLSIHHTSTFLFNSSTNMMLIFSIHLQVLFSTF